MGWFNHQPEIVSKYPKPASATELPFAREKKWSVESDFSFKTIKTIKLEEIAQVGRSFFFPFPVFLSVFFKGTWKSARFCAVIFFRKQTCCQHDHLWLHVVAAILLLLLDDKS